MGTSESKNTSENTSKVFWHLICYIMTYKKWSWIIVKPKKKIKFSFFN